MLRQGLREAAARNMRTKFFIVAIISVGMGAEGGRLNGIVVIVNIINMK